MSTYSRTTNFVTISCYKCGVLFGMSEQFYEQRKRDQATWYCMNGHGQGFRESPEAQLKAQLARTQEQLVAANARAGKAENDHKRVTKAHTRMRTRVMNGVCPCCNRTFQNLLRHMQTEHNGEMTLPQLRGLFGMTQGDVAEEINLSASTISHYEKGYRTSPRVEQRITRWMRQHVEEHA